MPGDSIVAACFGRRWQRECEFATHRVIYTTNAIESLNYRLSPVPRNRGAFPNDASIMKLLYQALKNAGKKWSLPIREWKAALNQFVILFSKRMSV